MDNYTTPEARSETSPIPVAKPSNPNVSIEFEKKDLSIGTARYRGAKPISRNLSMKPSLPGHPDNPITHANVEVHLRNDRGQEVPMTRRLVRYWLVRPLPGAPVENLGRWQIVGLTSSEFSPFAVSVGERPAETTFKWDRPGATDAPGFQGNSANDEPFGQLQEFLVGNATVGGAYYQTYTLWASRKIRVINTRAQTLSARDYREALRSIDSGEYSRTMRDKLFWMPLAETDVVQGLPAAQQP